MSNTDIKWFSFDNTNAPQLSNSWGCLIDVLDACLIAGFGSQLVSSLVIKNGVGTATFGTNHNFKQFQVVEITGANNSALNGEFKILGLTTNTVEFLINAPDQTAGGTINAKLASLGWTKAFNGAQKAVYRAKDIITNPYYLRVDNSRDPVYSDAYAKFAKVGILEACAGIDDISANQAPFDPTNPTKNWVGTGSGSDAIAGWFKWQYAVNESAAPNYNYYESEGATDGIRGWVLIGTKDSFYLINRATVSTVLEIPYGFGALMHNEKPKPFLFATNRYAPSNRGVLTATPLGNPARKEVAALYNYAGTMTNSQLFGLVAGFNDKPSGIVANNIKIDPMSGYILTPLYLVDPDVYIIGEIPLAKCCVNNATETANYSIFAEPDAAYIAVRYRTEAGGVLGVLFFQIY